MDRASSERLRREGIVLYLHVPPDELLGRLAADPQPERRPLLLGSCPEEEVQRLYALRDPHYRALAHHSVDGSADVASVCRSCLRVLSSSSI